MEGKNGNGEQLYSADGTPLTPGARVYRHDGRLFLLDGTPLVKRQVVIVYDCGDARAAATLENKVTSFLMNEYAKRGVDILFFRVIIPGVTVNEWSYSDAAQIINSTGIQSCHDIGIDRLDINSSGDPDKIPLETLVYIRGHGGVTLKGGFDGSRHPLKYNRRDLEVDPSSPVACGMGKVSEFWEDHVIPFLLEHLSPTTFYDRLLKQRVQVPMNDSRGLLRLLKNRYGHSDLTSADDFVSDIDPLREPTHSAKFLRERLGEDKENFGREVHIIPSVRNFATGTDFRLGGNSRFLSIPDDKAVILPWVMSKLPTDDPEIVLRRTAQKPRFGLINPSGIHDHPRELLIRHIMSLQGGEDVPVAGNVCSISGHHVTNPSAPFAPYKLAGLAYFVMYLGVKDWYILGKDETEVAWIRKKIELDPIVSFIFKEFEVTLHDLPLNKMQPEVVHGNENKLTGQVQELVEEAVQGKIWVLPSRKESPLRSPITRPATLPHHSPLKRRA